MYRELNQLFPLPVCNFVGRSIHVLFLAKQGQAFDSFLIQAVHACACGTRTLAGSCIDHFRSRARSKGIGNHRSSSTSVLFVRSSLFLFRLCRFCLSTSYQAVLSEIDCIRVLQPQLDACTPPRVQSSTATSIRPRRKVVLANRQSSVGHRCIERI